GMVFFIHIILYDSDRGLAMTSGQTVLVTDTGCEALTLAPTDLVVA
ncbi:MAG: aminopeptidase P family protein, partial [Inquilinus limosus]|nr:aminopeptidase P family protein [Inquilinus limosus]